jgi:hypothetical protein
MATSDRFRGFADECLTWARTARTDQQREAFLEMARAWTLAAARQEGTVPIASFENSPAQRPDRYNKGL